MFAKSACRCRSSNASLHTVELTGSPASSRAESYHSLDRVEQASPAAPALPPGLLLLTLHRARKLEKRGVFGKADPYCVLSLAGETARSNTVSNNQNPE